MADVLIQGTTSASATQRGCMRPLVWTSSDTGYLFYLDANDDLAYQKSTDGGSTWGSAVAVATGTIMSPFDVWFDKWTPGGTGTKIHFWYQEAGEDDLFYNYLDTASDSLGTAVNITNQTLSVSTDRLVSGTKSAGGTLIVAALGADVSVRYQNTWTSSDGSSWSAKSVSATESLDADLILLLPANLADPDDVWAVFWDASANEVSLKTYDASAPGWSETSIATSMTEIAPASAWPQISASIRHSDGHAIVTAWSAFDDAAADLRVWDINGAGSITELTNVVTNTAECFNSAVFIDQNTDDIYVSYLGKSDGSELALSAVKVYYKKSTDGGSTWGSEVSYSEDVADDFRSLWTDLGTSSCRFYLVWFDDDDNDIFGGYTNSVAITPPAGGTAKAPPPFRQARRYRTLRRVV